MYLDNTPAFLPYHAHHHPPHIIYQVLLKAHAVVSKVTCLINRSFIILGVKGFSYASSSPLVVIADFFNDSFPWSLSSNVASLLVFRNRLTPASDSRWTLSRPSCLHMSRAINLMLPEEFFKHLLTRRTVRNSFLLSCVHFFSKKTSQWTLFWYKK